MSPLWLSTGPQGGPEQGCTGPTWAYCLAWIHPNTDSADVVLFSADVSWPDAVFCGESPFCAESCAVRFWTRTSASCGQCSARRCGKLSYESVSSAAFVIRSVAVLLGQTTYLTSFLCGTHRERAKLLCSPFLKVTMNLTSGSTSGRHFPDRFLLPCSCLV